MKKRSDWMPKLIPALAFLLSLNLVSAQSLTISGKITDESGDAVIGAHVKVRDYNAGTITNVSGEYTFTTDLPTPFLLVFSGVGFVDQQLEITSVTDLTHNVQFQQEMVFADEIVVSASRVEESLLEASASIEKLTIADLQLTAAPNFYDELYKLKGVDMIVQSLTFRTPNSRGFNGYTNYRMNQFVDGVDNQSPGLSFAAGNIFGLSQLDVESVEFIIGASSALYGPGGMNGTLVMTSKNPYEYQGLSFSAQTGMMHVGADYRDQHSMMQEYNLRYAKALGDKFAFKITGSYLKADDWNAFDVRDQLDIGNPNSNRWTNSAYNGVNVYGDETAVSLSALEDAVAEGFVDAVFPDLEPGTPEYDEQINFIKDAVPDHDVTRTGWEEKDLVNYGTENMRLGANFNYKINDRVTAVVSSNFGRGTAVYSAQNRFSINDFSIVNYRAEVGSKDFFLRFYGVNEHSGDTYDAGALASFINEAWKPSEIWYQDYIEGFLNNKLGFDLDDERAHKFARAFADNRDEFGNIPFPDEPTIPQGGSEEFERYKSDIISTDLANGGAKVLDKSSMYHFEGMYNFDRHIESFDLLAGGSLRYNIVNSEGTVFFDEPGDPLQIYQLGAYAQVSDEWAQLKPTFSVRFDKNEYFDANVTPRLSVVYGIGGSKEKFVRASAQTAFRFPSISDQWTDLTVGPLQVIGGQPVVQSKYNFGDVPVYPLDGNNPIFSEPIVSDGEFIVPPFGPEKVTSFEVGFKGLYLNNRLWFDSYIYFNNYNGFLAQQLLAQYPNTDEELRYQTTISLDQPVNAYGWAMSTDYRLGRGFASGFNLSFNGVNSEAFEGTAYQLQFNTPGYRFNLYLNNRMLTEKLGFSVNYRWQSAFTWESSFGVGDIPAFGTLDAQLSYRLPEIKSMLKVGGSNLLNNYYTTSFGSSSVGGVYYISLVFDEMFNF